MARRVVLLFGALLITPLLAGSIALAVSARLAASHPAAARSLTTLSIGMGYVPSVQFAPFYVADQMGYYRSAGIRVNFSYALSPNLLQLVGAGRDDFAYADGTDAIAATAHGIPITYVAALFQRLPVALFSLSSKHIRRVTDLRGKSIGVPGPYGSTYVGLLAALHASGLRTTDVKIHSIGYTQAAAVVQGSVDAAVGYSNNEPLLLRRHGYRLNTIEVGTVTRLVGPGLVAGNKLIARDPGLVRRFVQASLRGLALTIKHPRVAFAAARLVHGLDSLRGRDIGDQYAVLLRSIQFWRSAETRTHGLGYAAPGQWRRSIAILRDIGQAPKGPGVARIVTNRFSRGAARE